jgi:hypothetical protein
MKGNTRREVLEQQRDTAQAELNLLDAINGAKEVLRVLQLHHESQRKGAPPVTAYHHGDLATRCHAAARSLSRWAQ